MGTKKKLGIFIALLIVGILLLAFTTALAPARKSGTTRLRVLAQEVVLNTRAAIYHCPSCELARRCGTDCVRVDLAEALRRHARPCEICGGVCQAAR